MSSAPTTPAVEVKLTLAAGQLLAEGLYSAVRDLSMHPDGTIRGEARGYVPGPLVGSWAIVEAEVAR